MNDLIKAAENYDDISKIGIAFRKWYTMTDSIPNSKYFNKGDKVLVIETNTGHPCHVYCEGENGGRAYIRKDILEKELTGVIA